MVAIISRAQWGAGGSTAGRGVALSQRRWFVGHWPGSSAVGADSFAVVRGIDRQHRVTQGWAVIGYNYLIDRQGRIFEGAGLMVRGVHSPPRNTDGFGVCFLVSIGEPLPQAMRNSGRALYDWLNRQTGRTLGRAGHSTHHPTSCPGPAVLSWINAGLPSTGGTPPPPPPGGVPAFPGRILMQPPIMRGEDVRTWQARARLRWSLTADGAYGPLSEGVCRDVQRAAGLAVDGRVGPNTWPATWRVTGTTTTPPAPPPPPPGLDGMEPSMNVVFHSNGRAVIGLANNITHVRLASSNARVTTTFPGSSFSGRTDNLAGQNRADISIPGDQRGVIMLQRHDDRPPEPVYLTWIEPRRLGVSGLLGALLGRLSAVLGLETKVTAASLGALLGGALTGLLERFVFHHGVPGIVAEVIAWAAPIVGAAVLGWLAPHTHRPDLAPPGPPNVTTVTPPPSANPPV
jgi:hypothetical protein